MTTTSYRSLLSLWSVTAAVLVGACQPAAVNKDAPPYPVPRDPVKWGRPDSVPSVYDFFIDARTGQPRGQTEFPLGQSVRVVLHDANPFLYEYRLTVARTTVTEASPVDFFNYAFGLSLPAGAVPSGAPAPSGGPVTAAVVDKFAPACAIAAKDTATFGDRARAASTAGDSLRDTLLAVQGQVRAVDKRFQASLDSLLDANESAAVVHGAALKADSSLRALDSIYTRNEIRFDTTNRRFKRRAEDLKIAFDSVTAKFPKCGSALAKAATVVKAVLEDTTYNAKALAAIIDSRSRVEQAQGVFRPIASDPLRFYLTHFLLPSRTPTQADITVARRARPRPPRLSAASASSGDGSAAKDPATNAPAAEGATTTPSKAIGTTTVTTTTTTLSEVPAAPGKKADTTTAPKSAGSTEAAFDTVTQLRVSFGVRSHFVMTAGMSWGRLAEREYTTIVQARSIGGGLADTITTVAYSKNSSGQTGPMLTLATRLPTRNGYLAYADGIHIVFGVGIGAKRPVEPNILAGLALSFFDERLFINGGAMIGRTTHAADSYGVNARLPRGVTTVPTTSRLVVEPGAALTFRVVPW